MCQYIMKCPIILGSNNKLFFSIFLGLWSYKWLGGISDEFFLGNGQDIVQGAVMGSCPYNWKRTSVMACWSHWGLTPQSHTSVFCMAAWVFSQCAIWQAQPTPHELRKHVVLKFFKIYSHNLSLVHQLCHNLLLDLGSLSLVYSYSK